MRVVINAQIDPTRSGGIAQVIIGLAHGLGRLAGEDEYVFVCAQDSAGHIEPYLGPNSRVEVNRRAPLPPVIGPRDSDGFWESFAPDVLHFPYQSYTRTNVPSVFNPHDLQHVHLPDLFSEQERSRREALYGQACRHASAVAVTSDAVKRDVAGHYGIPEARVHVIWWGAPTTVYDPPRAEDVETLCAKHHLPTRFALYPAQTWPHKNHARLIEALELLRDREGVVVPLVCTGALTDHHQKLVEMLRTRRMEDQVRFVGWVDAQDLMTLYRAAEMVVVPTLFEAISLPVFEAFAEGVPVACSTATSLPEQVGEAAVLFDPEDVEAIAASLGQLHEDAALRADLIQRGRQRVAEFSWHNTATQYRALYRAVARGGPSG